MPRVLFGVTVAMTAQGFLRDQLVALAQQGWEVHLACSDDDGTDSFQRLQALSGVTVHKLRMVRQPDPLQDAISLWSWRRLLKSVKPDLVVCSTPKAGLLGTVASWMGGVRRRVYHVRGLRAEGLSGPMASVSRLTERIATAAATHVLLDSPSLLAGMRLKHLLSETKGEVLGAGSCCGVDTQWFRPPTSTERQVARQSLGLSSEDFAIGFVGRLAVDKGVRELIEVAEGLQEEDSRIKLIMVGPLEDSVELEKHLARITSNDWVRVLDRTDNPRSIFWALDVFCLPSYREGFPIAPLEAQACGLPVVTTDATGCVDSIKPNVTGFCVPPFDKVALANALNLIARSTHRQQGMGEAARDWVTREFETSSVNSRVIAYLNAIALSGNEPAS